MHSGAAAAMARARKVSGVFVQLSPEDFTRLLDRHPEPMVVRAKGIWFGRGWRYLFSYKGLAFYTRTPEPLPLPGRAEVIDAGQLWLPP